MVIVFGQNNASRGCLSIVILTKALRNNVVSSFLSFFYAIVSNFYFFGDDFRKSTLKSDIIHVYKLYC